MSPANATVVLAAIGFLGFDDAKKDDAEAIKGKWVAVSLKQGPVALPDELVKTFKMDFAGKKYVNTAAGQSEEGEYTFDGSKSPKTIDFDIQSGPEKGKKQVGIYKLDGGKLTIVASLPGSTERPTSFEPEADAPVFVLVLEREKP